LADTIQISKVDYTAPPVVEVVCGVVFEPIMELSTAFFGLLWSQYRKEFPKTYDQPMIQSPIPIDSGKPMKIIPQIMTPRVWFMSEDERQLIQVQQDRFHFNWRRQEKSDEYPHFKEVYKSFKNHYETLAKFLSESGTQEAREQKYELTYINHIPVDNVWQRLERLGLVFPDLAWRETKSRFLPAPTNVHWEAQFPLPDGAGILSAKIRTAREKATGKLVLLFDLTAHGPAGTLNFDKWFELSHHWVVQGFNDLTGTDMHHEVWQRKVVADGL
jgi:uncharacterized protein (TIGR04255 family)